MASKYCPLGNYCYALGMPGQLHIQIEGPLGWIIFDHPERRNALTVSMWEAVPDAFQTLANDSGIRVILLRGAGESAFISGADLSEFQETRSTPEAVEAYDRLTERAYHAVAQSPWPVIAMIQGGCFGGGLTIASLADLRYGAKEASFGLPPARLGIAYSPRGVQALAGLVGPAAAREILFTARHYSASTMKSLGFLNEVLPGEMLETHVTEVASRIAENAPLSICSARTLLRKLEMDENWARDPAVQNSIRNCFESEDYAEGVRAFLEKRNPRFRGC